MAPYNTILLFGPPGSGKGTQGRVLGKIPGFRHVECGEVFRRLDASSKIGEVFLQYSRKGELVPDSVTIDIWADHIDSQITAGTYNPDQDILVMDGIPRTVEQAKLLVDKINPVRIYNLVCEHEEEMIQRIMRRALKENRPDDTKESVIRHRWEVYRAETEPVLDYYSDKNIVNLDAEGTCLEVLDKIVRDLIQMQSEASA